MRPQQTVLAQPAPPALPTVAGEGAIVGLAGSPALARVSAAVPVSRLVTLVLKLFPLLLFRVVDLLSLCLPLNLLFNLLLLLKERPPPGWLLSKGLVWWQSGQESRAGRGRGLGGDEAGGCASSCGRTGRCCNIWGR